ncbi:1385_t:CDS:2, partial [Funneliformis caledonium]
DLKPDRELARRWENERSHKQVYLYQPTINRTSGVSRAFIHIQKGNTLPDGTKIEKVTPLDLVQSDDDDHLSQENNDEDEGIPDLKDKVINNSKKWNLPSELHVGEIFDKRVSTNAEKAKNKKKFTICEKAILRYGASNIINLSIMSEWFSAKDIKFMAKDYADLLKEDVNGAYKLCIENHVNSEENGYMYKISKIYAEFIYRNKNKVDILDYAGDTHTELYVVMKAFKYIIEGLNPGFGIHQKWDESFCSLSKSNDYNKGRKCDLRFLLISGAVGDRYRSARVNQSILNDLLNLNLTDEQAKNIKVPFMQVGGISGQILIEDLVEGFYVVFPELKFELPTRLQHIKKLKSAVNIINFII